MCSSCVKGHTMTTHTLAVMLHATHATEIDRELGVIVVCPNMDLGFWFILCVVAIPWNSRTLEVQCVTLTTLARAHPLARTRAPTTQVPFVLYLCRSAATVVHGKQRRIMLHRRPGVFTPSARRRQLYSSAVISKLDTHHMCTCAHIAAASQHTCTHALTHSHNCNILFFIIFVFSFADRELHFPSTAD